MNERITRLIADTCRDFERADVVMRDGTKLVAYEYGCQGAPWVVVVNPIGVPIVISSRLIRSLGERYRVICWEQRGYGAESAQFFSRPHDYAVFLTDLEEIVADRCPCALVGVCSGASLAISAVARGLVDASPLVLVSPAVYFEDGYSQSLFDLAVVPYLRRISGDRQFAKEWVETAAAAQNPRAVAEDDDMVIEAGDTASLKSVDSLSVHARVVHIFTDVRLDQEIAALKQKTFVFCAADDQVVSVKSVRRLCSHLPNAELQEHPRGGHFLVFKSRAVRETICDVINSFRAFNVHVA